MVLSASAELSRRLPLIPRCACSGKGVMGVAAVAVGCHASVLSGARQPGRTHLEKFLGKATWIWREPGPLTTFENSKGRKGKWKKGNWSNIHLMV